jgi:hypothetical protein
MFGACKCCLEKDTRIADLKSEIAFLRSLAAPTRSNGSLSLLNLEQDAVLSGHQEQIHISMTPEEMEAQDAIDREASNVLSGNY